MGTHPPDDAALVQSAQRGSVDAFTELTARHSLMVYRLSLRMLGNERDAQDLAQDCMLAAWRGLATFRADAQYTTWLYRIVTRRALNHLSRTRICAPLADYEYLPSTDATPPERAEQHAAIDAVTRAVLALPAAQRAAVVLHHLEGLTYEQTAAATGTTTSSVSSHLYRARHALQLSLADFATQAA